MSEEQPDWYTAVQQRARDEAATTPEPTVKPVEYTVNCVPEDDIDSHLFGLRVQYRGAGRYAVIRHGQCLGADGTWAHGIKDYDLDTALRLAKEHAPLATVNGHTVSDAITRRKKREERDG